MAATVLALLAAVAVLVALSAGGGTDPVSSGTLELSPLGEQGDPMSVEYTDVDGSKHVLADRLDGRPMLVNFFAEWCTPCVAEMPDLEAVSRELAGRVDFFGLAVNDRAEDTARMIERTGVTYPWSRDMRGDVANAAAVKGMPSTMLIDAEGSIVKVHTGPLDESELRALIDEHLGVAP